MAKQESFSIDLSAEFHQNEPLLRVPKVLLNAKKEALYIPQFISLGPYHYHNSKLQDARLEGPHNNMLRRKTSTKEVYKVQFVSECWPNKIGPDAGERWDEMVKTIIGMRAQVECFYNFQIPEDVYSKNFAVLMLVDSLFLLCFFLFSTDSGDDLRVRIKCDILKLENQIPLSVLCKILKEFELPQFPNWEASIKALLCNANRELSPFDFSRHQSIDIRVALHSKPHLLGCIHAFVLPFLEIRGDSASGGSTLLQKISSFLDCVVEKMCGIFFCFKHKTEGKLPINSYTAKQLARAGIKFKSFSKLPANIRFDKISHTLYLPRMTVSSLQTEGFFGNLVALELNDWAGAKSASSGHHVDWNYGATSNRHHVRRFIQLTNCLIDTLDDVHVLRKSKVISPKTTLGDKDIATIWNSMRQPIFHSQIQPPEELKKAIDEVLKANYYKTKIRIRLSEFFDYYYEKYFLHPWTFIALLAAIFLLFLTVIQTYCSVWGCSSVNQLYENL